MIINKKYAVLPIIALASGVVVGAPSELDSESLDTVTAGSRNHASAAPAPNGGAIVGNGSTANLVSTGEVLISDGAQMDARALNFVNASESTVANGVNIFNGSAAESADFDAAEYNIEQLNSVTQDQRRLASLPGYDRGANVDSSYTDSGSSTSSSSASVYDEVIDLERTFVLDDAITDGGFDRSSAPTFSLMVDGELQLGPDGNIINFDVNQYDVEFNAPSASNSIGVVFNGGLHYEIDGGGLNVDTGDLGIIVDIQLPDVIIDFDAMGCVALNGSCTIDGSRTESSETISDHSTLYTMEETDESTSEWSNSGSESIQAAFELRDAQAEYIVVDESSIDVIAGYMVSLSGGAQSNLRAMNAVNAAGSAVANGVNVSVMEAGVISSASPVYNVSQSNIIVHSR